MIACACSEKLPNTLRELFWPRSTLLGSRISPCTPSTRPPVLLRPDAMAEAERDQPVFLRFAHAPHERRDQAGSGAPGDVEARHRIAVAGGQIAAALGPADDREPAHAHGVQPRPLLAGGEIYIGL